MVDLADGLGNIEHPTLNFEWVGRTCRFAGHAPSARAIQISALGVECSTFDVFAIFNELSSSAPSGPAA
jgi:hypothetical protein